MSQPAPRTSVRLKVDFAQASDPGRDPNKQVNEDSCGYAETRFGHLMVLCDGMGGHYGGQEASRTAISTIFEIFETAPGGMTPAVTLKAAIEEAGRRVYLLGGPPENRTRPGSTVVAMLLHDRGVDVAHVGDSRAYAIRGGQIYPLTRDHSMVQGMIDAGMLTEEQAIGHPDANKITRALGMKPEVDVEVRPEPMELFPGDVLLQSSDGLTDLALGADILGATRQALASGPVQHACNSLVQLANNRGGHDNITVQIVRVVEVGQRAMTTIPGDPSPAAAPQETVAMTTLDSTRTPPAVQANPMAAQMSFNAPKAAPMVPQPPASPAGVSPTVGDQTPFAPNPGPLKAPPGALISAPAGALISAPAGALISAPAGALGAPVMPAAPAGAPAAGGEVGLHGTHVMRAAGPAPTAVGVTPTPTMNEAPPSSHPWTSGMYGGPPVPPPAPPPPGLGAAPLPPTAQNIGAYHDAGPAALPLPPPAPLRQGFGGPTQVGRGMGPLPGGRPLSQLPASSSLVGARPSKGGIVFVIIGLSAVIAVLILVILWALVLR